MKLLFILLFFLFGCVTIKPTVIEKTYLELDVFYEGEHIPENYNILGDIFIGPYDMTRDCGYDSILNELAERTKELGGDAFKITELKEPSVDTPCYRAYALALISND